jgi:hypothetical protein
LYLVKIARLAHPVEMAKKSGRLVEVDAYIEFFKGHAQSPTDALYSSFEVQPLENMSTTDPDANSQLNKNLKLCLLISPIRRKGNINPQRSIRPRLRW